MDHAGVAKFCGVFTDLPDLNIILECVEVTAQPSLQREETPLLTTTGFCAIETPLLTATGFCAMLATSTRMHPELRTRLADVGRVCRGARSTRSATPTARRAPPPFLY